VAGGGREYVRQLSETIADIRIDCPVESIARNSAGVQVVFNGGQREHFSQVVLACHGDQALGLLADPVDLERKVLSRVRFQPNHAVLHTDTTLLPRNRDAWAAWNYVAGTGEPDARPVSVSYLLNKLQKLPFTTPVIVTLNPTHAPREELVIDRFDYAHPVFDCAAIDAQRDLPAIQGKRRTWYCGAWTGYGFHEDGLKSAMSIANAFGLQIPWKTNRLAA
jgi:predicted NAD/FAD-binding protein